MVIEGNQRAFWLEVAVAAVASLLLYNFPLGFVLFLVPLQIVLVRRGEQAGFYAAAAWAVGLAGMRLIAGRDQALIDTSTNGVVVLVEISFLLALFAGLWLMQARQVSGYRRYQRLLIAAAAAGVIMLPGVLSAAASQQFLTGLQGIADAVTQGVREALEQADEPSSALAVEALNPQSFLRAAIDLLLRTYLVYVFALVGLSWWLGTQIGARSLGRSSGIPRIAMFKIDSDLLWPLIGAWSLVLLDTLGAFDSVRFLRYLAWNAALTLLLLYGLQGFGIIQALLTKVGVSPVLKGLIFFGVLVLLMSPTVNVVLIVAVPGLGVSETWIDFGRFPKEDGKQ